jgi:hypothetical protein
MEFLPMSEPLLFEFNTENNSTNAKNASFWTCELTTAEIIVKKKKRYIGGSGNGVVPLQLQMHYINLF